MCRFVAYLGKRPVLLDSILDAPENSLISQSRHAREGLYGLNADGFGIAWYQHSVDNLPAVFKSILPEPSNGISSTLIKLFFLGIQRFGNSRSFI